MSTDIKIRPWLLWTSLGVLVIAIAFLAWAKYGNNGILNLSASPTPVKSNSLSPSPSASGAASPAATNNSGKTNSHTPTPKPEIALPAGWKVDSQTMTLGRNTSASGSYQVFMRNEWNATDGGDSLWQSSKILYGTDKKCAPNGGYGTDTVTFNNYCLFSVSLVRSQNEPASTANEYYFETLQQRTEFPGKSYAIVSFTSLISAADKQVVLDSFKLTQ